MNNPTSLRFDDPSVVVPSIFVLFATTFWHFLITSKHGDFIGWPVRGVINARWENNNLEAKPTTSAQTTVAIGYAFTGTI